MWKIALIRIRFVEFCIINPQSRRIITRSSRKIAPLRMRFLEFWTSVHSQEES